MGARKDPPNIDHPHVFSVSQAETFLLCKRKWAYLKIDGLEDPGTSSSKLGGEVHEQLENFLEKGKPINVSKQAGRVALPAVPFLPPPMYPGMEIEEWFCVKVGDAYYRGLKDLRIKTGWKSKNPFISDHKTTKNFAWAKTAEDLTGGLRGVGDTQAGVYSYHEMVENPEVTNVDLQWTYLRTTGTPKAEPTIAVISKEQVSRIISKLENTTEEMIKTKRDNRTALTVLQDPTACDAFGGCAFRDLCNLTPHQKLRAIMNQKKTESGVLGRLKARKEAKEAGKTVESVIKAPIEDTLEVEVKESTTAEINPPEEKIAPVYTADNQEQKKKGRPAKTEQKTEQEPVQQKAGILGRAVDAFLDVIIDEIADRVVQRLKK